MGTAKWSSSPSRLTPPPPLRQLDEFYAAQLELRGPVLVDGFWPRGIFGQDGGKSCLPAKGRSEPERWRVAAGFAAAPGPLSKAPGALGKGLGLMSLHAEAS